MIKLQIIGNLGGDCVLKEINGKNVMNFTVAHTERFKDAQGVQKERTTWVNCAYWSDRTAIAQYLKKGQLIFAEGTPEVDPYLKDNQPAATLRMRVREIQLLGGRTDGGGTHENQNQHSPASAAPASNHAPQQSHSTAEVQEGADDLPF